MGTIQFREQKPEPWSSILGENRLYLSIGLRISGPQVTFCTRFQSASPTYSFCFPAWKFLHSSIVDLVNPVRVCSTLYRQKIIHSSSVDSTSLTSIHLQKTQQVLPAFIPAYYSLKTFYSSLADSVNLVSIHHCSLQLKDFSLITNCSCNPCQHFVLFPFQLEDLSFHIKLEIKLRNSKTWYFRLHFLFRWYNVNVINPTFALPLRYNGNNIESNYEEKKSLLINTRNRRFVIVVVVVVVVVVSPFSSFKSSCSFFLMFSRRRNWSSYVEPKTRLHERNFGTAPTPLWPGVHAGYPLL